MTQPPGPFGQAAQPGRAAEPAIPASVDGGTAPPQPDFYLEDDRVVFTAAYHIRRGTCCGSGCRHCPFDPPHVADGMRLSR